MNLRLGRESGDEFPGEPVHTYLKKTTPVSRATVPREVEGVQYAAVVNGVGRARVRGR